MVCLAENNNTPQQYAIRFRVAANKWAPLASLDVSGEMIPDSLLRNIAITFGDVASIDMDAAAVCIMEDEHIPKINVNVEKWSMLNEWRREAVIFHELGHCILGRAHDDVVINGRYKSIMNSYLIDGDVYLLNRDYYQQELFQSTYHTPSYPVILK